MLIHDCINKVNIPSKTFPEISKQRNRNIYIFVLCCCCCCCRFSRVWLCDPIDGSPPGSAIPGILQARTLEWVAISFSNARKWKVKVKLLSRVRLLATPWTAAYQAPLSLGFSRQEHWSGLPLPFAISFSNAWKWKVKVKSLSHVHLFVTPWTAAYQGSSVHGIFQARVLEWVAMAFSVLCFRYPDNYFNSPLYSRNVYTQH